MRGRRLGRLLAALALAVQLALPALAVASPAGGALVPVCTAAGLVWMDPAASGTPASGADAQSLHCPLCWAPVAPAVVPPETGPAAPWPRPATVSVPSVAAVPTALVPWVLHRGRAPPSPA